jgi:hypothetical protein
MLANIIRNRKKTGIGGGGGGIVIDGGDPYYSAVSLMLSMDGTNGSTTFTDSSLNALAVTATSATISTTQSKYGGASGYFDGSTGYLSLTGNNSFQFGTGDFTVEMWVYISANAANQQTFLDIRGAATATPFTFGIYQSKLLFYDGAVRQSSATVTSGQWYHFAACRSNGTLRLFIDGISYYSASSATNFTTGANSIYIGRGFDSAAYYTNGYIDDLRISRFARYVSNFAPPTAALPTTASSTVADPYYNYTSLLLHMDGANASTNFVDSGPNALAVTAVGNAQISTTQNKFGGASGYFDGSGDYLSLAATTAFGFGTGDYTAECWIYISGNQGTDRQLIDFRPSPSVPGVLFISPSNKLTFWNGTAIGGTGTALTTGVWYHVALCRSSGTTRCFLNGTLEWSTSVAMDFTSSRSLGIGAYLPIGASVAVFLGYIDDLRITKYARYTSAFTPPTTAFPNA